MDELRAYIWYCGDEWCECTQPVVERVQPNPRVTGAVLRERIWEGTFHSGASAEEYAEQKRQLEEARERFNIPA